MEENFVPEVEMVEELTPTQAPRATAEKQPNVLYLELSNTQKKFAALETEINNRKQEIQRLEEEKFRLQGEYRVIVRLAESQGLIDKDGNFIQ